MLITKLSTHASDRIATAYKTPIHTQKVIATVQRCAQQGYKVRGKDTNENYIVHLNHGVYIVKGDVIITFIHISRMGDHGTCQRAYLQIMSNAKVA